MNTEQALDAFLATVEAAAFRMAKISTASTEDALDIVQDAMIKFVEKYAHKAESDWKPLFYRVLNSRIIDWHRRRKVRAFIMHMSGHNDELDLVASQTPNPEQQLQQAGAMDGLELALQELPVRQQQAVWHRLWDGMSTQQTAIAMQVSSGSVKTHYSRALNTLRQRLGDHWP